MAVIEYTGEREDETARNVEVYDDWIVAIISDGETTDRHCIARSEVERVVGHMSGDDLDIEL